MIRRIETQEEREKREKRRTRILTGLMFIILLGSVGGYALLSGPGSTQNNNNGQNNGNNQWSVDIGGKIFYFSNSPQSVSNIPVIISENLNNFNGQPLYISTDNRAVYNEIASTLGNFTERIQEACYGNCTLNLPEKDCTNNFVIVNSSSQNSVSEQGKCIFVNGDMRSVDAFLYKVLGVIK